MRSQNDMDRVASQGVIGSKFGILRGYYMGYGGYQPTY